MTVHLVKLCVGAESIQDLEDWQRARTKQKQALMHITRNTPKRAQEVLDGGSLYWVIKSFVCARQRIVELRPLQIDGIVHCGLIYDAQLVRVRPQPRRAFQGWRYLEAKDAPPDMKRGSAEADMPDDMRRELAELGLL